MLKKNFFLIDITNNIGISKALTKILSIKLTQPTIKKKEVIISKSISINQFINYTIKTNM